MPRADSSVPLSNEEADAKMLQLAAESERVCASRNIHTLIWDNYTMSFQYEQICSGYHQADPNLGKDFRDWGKVIEILNIVLTSVIPRNCLQALFYLSSLYYGLGKGPQREELLLKVIGNENMVELNSMFSGFIISYPQFSLIFKSVMADDC